MMVIVHLVFAGATRRRGAKCDVYEALPLSVS